MIIQGSNHPIALTFDKTFTAEDLSVSLYFGFTLLRHWGLTDVVTDGKVVKCPLTQEETLAFPSGKCTIEVKWLDEDGLTHHAQTVQSRIITKQDVNILGEENAT